MKRKDYNPNIGDYQRVVENTKKINLEVWSTVKIPDALAWVQFGKRHITYPHNQCGSANGPTSYCSWQQPVSATRRLAKKNLELRRKIMMNGLENWRGAGQASMKLVDSRRRSR